MKKWICAFLCIGFISLLSGKNIFTIDTKSIATEQDEPLLIGYGYIQVWDMLNKEKVTPTKRYIN